MYPPQTIKILSWGCNQHYTHKLWVVVSNIFNFHFGTIIQFDEHIFEMGGKKTPQLETWGHKKTGYTQKLCTIYIPRRFFPRKSIPKMGATI